MTDQIKTRLIEENEELKRELHALRCRYGDLADLVSEIAFDYEAGNELVFIAELVKLYRKQQGE